MNIGLIYSTKTGHSKKIALALEDALKIQAQNINTNPSLKDIDLLLIVGGIYGGKAAPELLQYIGNIEKGQVKKAVLFTSSASKKGVQSDIRTSLTDKGTEVAEQEFTCPGNFLFVGIGHPNKTDLQGAVDFAKKFIA